jgi:hypothetical protein
VFAFRPVMIGAAGLTRGHCRLRERDSAGLRRRPAAFRSGWLLRSAGLSGLE